MFKTISYSFVAMRSEFKTSDRFWLIYHVQLILNAAIFFERLPKATPKKLDRGQSSMG